MVQGRVTLNFSAICIKHYFISFLNSADVFSISSIEICGVGISMCCFETHTGYAPFFLYQKLRVYIFGGYSFFFEFRKGSIFASLREKTFELGFCFSNSRNSLLKCSGFYFLEEIRNTLERYKSGFSFDSLICFRRKIRRAIDGIEHFWYVYEV
jgi:hypothetical protein